MPTKTTFPILLLWVILALIPLAVAGARPETNWKQIVNAAQGYRLEAPAAAEVIRHEPEGVLRILLPAQVISLHWLSDSSGQPVDEWVKSNLLDESRRGNDPFIPVFPVVEQGAIIIAGQPAYAVEILGPVVATRRVVVTGPTGGWLVIDLPRDADPSTAERILASLEFLTPDDMSSLPDSGLRVDWLNSSQNITALPVPQFKQTDPHWACDQLGSCWCYGGCGAFTSIADAGCYVTAEAMVFSYYEEDFATPKELDDCLTQHGGYGLWEGCGWGLCRAAYDAVDACQPANVQYASISGDLTQLDRDLQSGYPAIAWVDYSTHYVVVIGKTNGLYDVLDPLYNRRQIFPGYITFVIRYHGERHEPAPTTIPTPMPSSTLNPLFTERNFFPVCIKESP